MFRARQWTGIYFKFHTVKKYDTTNSITNIDHIYVHNLVKYLQAKIVDTQCQLYHFLNLLAVHLADLWYTNYSF